jgi:hypothetical protein
MYWDEKIETLKPADLQALQLKRLKKNPAPGREGWFLPEKIRRSRNQAFIHKNTRRYPEDPVHKKTGPPGRVPVRLLCRAAEKSDPYPHNIWYHGKADRCRIYPQ